MSAIPVPDGWSVESLRAEPLDLSSTYEAYWYAIDQADRTRIPFPCREHGPDCGDCDSPERDEFEVAAERARYRTLRMARELARWLAIYLDRRLAPIPVVRHPASLSPDAIREMLAYPPLGTYLEAPSRCHEIGCPCDRCRRAAGLGLRPIPDPALEAPLIETEPLGVSGLRRFIVFLLVVAALGIVLGLLLRFYG